MLSVQAAPSPGLRPFCLSPAPNPPAQPRPYLAPPSMAPPYQRAQPHPATPIGHAPSGHAPVARVSLPTSSRQRSPEGTRHTSCPRTPSSYPRPWQHRDPVSFGLRFAAAAAASSCVPNSLWLVTQDRVWLEPGWRVWRIPLIQLPPSLG